jgi:hypothetical protein
MNASTLVWSGHSFPLLLILILQGARMDPYKTVEEGRFSAA